MWRELATARVPVVGCVGSAEHAAYAANRRVTFLHLYPDPNGMGLDMPLVPGRLGGIL
jgi:hypothetical protein